MVNEIQQWAIGRQNNCVGYNSQICSMNVLNKKSNILLNDSRINMYIRSVAIWNLADVIFVNETCVVKRWMVQIESR